jgi:hypothetical protein
MKKVTYTYCVFYLFSNEDTRISTTVGYCEVSIDSKLNNYDILVQIADAVYETHIKPKGHKGTVILTSAPLLLNKKTEITED